MNLKTTLKTVLVLLAQATVLMAQESTGSFQNFREVRRLQADAQAKIVQKEHEDAADLYLKIADLETTRARKAAAILQAADQFMLADEANDALEHYQDVLQNYSLYAPHDHVVRKLRTLAENFIIGKGTFLSLRDVSGAIKIYELIIREAPATHVSNRDRFRLAELLRQEDRPEEAVAIYQTIAKKEIRNWDARTEMAIVLAKLAQQSDGDGTKTRAAVREAKLVLAYKPDHPKAGQLKALIANSYELTAKRLLLQAEFYLIEAHRRPAAARRYLHDVILKYPDSKAAKQARHLLKTVPALVALERNPQAPQAEQQTKPTPTPTTEPATELPKAKPAFEKPSPIRKDPKPAFEKPTAVKGDGKPAFDQKPFVRKDGKPAFEKPTATKRDGKPAFEKPSEFFKKQHGLTDNAETKPAFEKPSEYFKLVHGLKDEDAKPKPAFDKPSQFHLDQLKQAEETPQESEAKRISKPALPAPPTVNKTCAPTFQPLPTSPMAPQESTPLFQPIPIARTKQAPGAKTDVTPSALDRLEISEQTPKGKPALPAPPAVNKTSAPAFQPHIRAKASAQPVFQPGTLNAPASSSGFIPSPLNRPTRKATFK